MGWLLALLTNTKVGQLVDQIKATFKRARQFFEGEG